MIHGAVEHFKEGGFWMWPILIALFVTLTISAERFYFLWFVTNENKDGLLKGLNNQILRGDLQGAVRFLNSQRQGPLARILKAGLLKVHRPDLEVQAALDEASLREVPNLEKRTGYLVVLSNGATLLGLLGTIIGMIRSFAAVASADPASKATMLALGISEAMNCTAFGLIVAITGLLGFAVLNGKTQSIEDDINEATVQVMNLIVNNRQKVNLSNVAPAAE